ncbi:MerR family DNA-binding transcriptional regulator [Candidatus Woesebacteria bacterium]|nr:MAG: MerR family DNA-binding transcriptional regulator [Candidatus Woesebacteria bacterium]
MTFGTGKEKILRKKIMKKVKVGQLALKAGVLPSTIRYYAKEGLLEVVEKTPGGYQLFDEDKSLKIISEVKRYQSKRLSITEIKERIGGK